jgi:hypothetical protein
VILIDAKKKELVGELKKGNSDYGPHGQPIEVNMPMISRTSNWGKVISCGIYDISANLAECQPGVDHHTGTSPSTAFGTGSIG